MERLFSRRKSVAGAAALTLLLASCKDDPTPATPDQPTNPDQPTQPVAWPAIQSAIAKDAALEAKVDKLLGEMTLEEKVGQIVQAEINDVTPEDVKTYHLGSVLNGGGSWPNKDRGALVADWYMLADKLWEASMDKANPRPIPLIWGTDAVHGHNNVKGATFFPQNIGLGAANDPDLLRRIGEVTAREVARTGIDWAFAPTIAVVRDDRWGRTYEGFSEDPAIVEAYAGKIVEGLQGQLGKDAKSGERVIATAKHFLGDGGTTKGTDQGITVVTEQQLLDLHARGYFSALTAGAQTVMASYNSWQDAAQGNNAKAYKMHGNKYLLTDVLKTKMGFDGFVISDWNGLGQIKTSNSDATRNCSNDDCPQAINAGVDMAMIPASADWKAFITHTIAEVKSGEIPQARLDDAVRRILRVKFRMGLFDKPKPSARVSSHDIGTEENRAVAREAVRKSLVLLKNNDDTLPLARTAKVLVAGKSADSLSNQSGGWSISWQGKDIKSNAEFGGGTTLFGAVKRLVPSATLDSSKDGALADASYDVAIVVVGETPYAEGQGDITERATLSTSRELPEDFALLQALKAKGVKRIVTVLYSGRPLYANKEMNVSDAFVAAWLPGTEGDGLADVLFRKADGTINYDFQGKLSYSWPKSPCQVALNKGDAGYSPLFAYGFGLTYAQPARTGVLAEESPTLGCDEEPPSSEVATSPEVMFDAGNKNGWVMRLGGPSNSYAGLEVAQGTNGTTSIKEISATPVDYGRQWAAVHAVWTGTGQIYMQTQDSQGRDMQTYFNSTGSLVFETKVDKAPAAQVNLSVHCVHPCLGEIPLADTLKALEGKGWSEVAVPLACFNNSKFKPKQVNTPFLIWTEGALDLTVANIRWDPKKAGNVSCGSDTILPLADRDVYVNGISDTALFAAPAGWTAGAGTVNVTADYDIGGGEKVIDVQMSGLKEQNGNGGMSLGIKSPTYFDASASASGGVELELRVLDYGGTTQGFWVKSVCERNPGGCATGDLTTLVGRPAVGEWKTVRIPYTNASYGSAEQPWNNKRISSVFEMLPAWGDQAGNIHFQLRNVRLKKSL